MVLRALFHSVMFALLTLLTQIGGLAYLAALMVRRSPLVRVGLFVVFYASLGVVSTVAAPAFGRVPLPCFGEPLRVQSPIYCALNRHYVSPDLGDYVLDLAQALNAEHPGTFTLALDANFPFLDGFPLLPHLSHDDGDKIDLAFFYRTAKGNYAPGKTKSPLGYWAFETPAPGSTLPCAGRDDFLTLRWDMNWFAWFRRNLSLDRDRTAAALRWMTVNIPTGRQTKILLEPHLVRTLQQTHPIIRFQGCRAARHDDHIHLQLSRD